MRKAEWNARIEAKQFIIRHMTATFTDYAPEYQLLSRVWHHINAPLFGVAA